MSNTGFRGPNQWTHNPDDNSWFKNYRSQARLTVAPSGADVWTIQVAEWEGAWSLPPQVRQGLSGGRAKRIAELCADAQIGPHDDDKDLTHEYVITYQNGGTRRWWARSHSVEDEAFVVYLGVEDEELPLLRDGVEHIEVDGERIFP